MCSTTRAGKHDEETRRPETHCASVAPSSCAILTNSSNGESSWRGSANRTLPLYTSRRHFFVNASRPVQPRIPTLSVDMDGQVTTTISDFTSSELENTR